MMQAAARSYRLNQTHAHCKVVYLFAEDDGANRRAVDEPQAACRETAHRRYQADRAGCAHRGRGRFEQALLDAIGRDETLFDPTELFKAEAKVSEINQEDAAYWNVEEVTLVAEDVTADEPDALIAAALELGATIAPIEPVEKRTANTTLRPVEAITAYLESVHIVTDEGLWTQRRGELLALLDGGTAEVIAAWLTEQHVVFPALSGKSRGNSSHWRASRPTPRLHFTSSPRRLRRQHRNSQREPSREPLMFPRREAVPDAAFTQQLALF